MANKIKPTGCCPPFDSSPWNEKTLIWKNKKFIKDSVFTFFYIPINFGQVISRMMKKVEAGKAATPFNMCLADHTSKWNMNLYLAVDREIDGAKNTILDGEYLSKVYEGDFKETGKWCNDFEKYAASKGKKIKKWYMWYTTCPKCAKAYGKNYVVIVGAV